MSLSMPFANLPLLQNRGGDRTYQAVLNASPDIIYDPSDVTSMYQVRGPDNGSGNALAAVDSVVAIMLDKSQMGNRTVAQFIDSQPNLVTNGTFATDTDWTKGSGWTISGGQAVATSVASTVAISQTSLGMTVGQWYHISIDVTVTSGSCEVYLGTSGSGTAIALTSIASTGTAIIAVGDRRAGEADSIFIRAGGSGFTGTVDNVVVKELTGNGHLTTNLNARRPILRQSGALYYVEADGVDDFLFTQPLYDLGNSWYAIAGFHDQGGATSGDRAFTTSNGFQGALRGQSSNWVFLNSSSVATNVCAGTPADPAVLTVQQASASSMTGRYNGANDVASFTPFDTSVQTRGLALFTQQNNFPGSPLDGEFYGGVFSTGTITNAQRDDIEAWVASVTGVTL